MNGRVPCNAGGDGTTKVAQGFRAVFACNTPCTPQLLCDNLMGEQSSCSLSARGRTLFYVIWRRHLPKSTKLCCGQTIPAKSHSPDDRKTLLCCAGYGEYWNNWFNATNVSLVPGLLKQYGRRTDAWRPY